MPGRMLYSTGGTHQWARRSAEPTAVLKSAWRFIQWRCTKAIGTSDAEIEVASQGRCQNTLAVGLRLRWGATGVPWTVCFAFDLAQVRYEDYCGEMGR